MSFFKPLFGREYTPLSQYVIPIEEYKQSEKRIEQVKQSLSPIFATNTLLEGTFGTYQWQEITQEGERRISLRFGLKDVIYINNRQEHEFPSNRDNLFTSNGIKKIRSSLILLSFRYASTSELTETRYTFGLTKEQGISKDNKIINILTTAELRTLTENAHFSTITPGLKACQLLENITRLSERQSNPVVNLD